MIVRWGLPELPGLLAELGIGRPMLISTARWGATELPFAIPDERRFHGVQGHAPASAIDAAVQRSVTALDEWLATAPTD